MDSLVNFRSHRTQLLATAVAASATTVGAVFAYQALSRKRRRRDLSADILASISNSDAVKPPSPFPEPSSTVGNTQTTRATDTDQYAYDEGLIREQLARNYAFFGEDGMAKVRKGSVAIIGCGGVGSAVAVMCARSGVSKIRLVDFDQVTLSSLNRHATATLDDVGLPKVKSIEAFIKQTCRWVSVEPCIDIWRKETGGDLLDGVDWVIGKRIDNIQTKVDLLKYCHDHKIKVFAAMGAGAKCDPTRIQISDISYTVYDPLARSVRRRLRLEGVSSGIPVVYSTEVPGDVKLLPLPEEEFQKGPVKELGVFDDFRVRILPVLGPIPAIFGLHIATYILCELAGKPILNPLPVKNRRKVYERLLRDFLHREEKLTGQTLNRLPIDEDDVSFIFEDLHRGRSVLPPHEVPTRPALVRWDLTRPVTLDNCVVMELKDADRHIKSSRDADGKLVDARTVWGQAVQDIIDSRSREVARYQEWNA